MSDKWDRAQRAALCQQAQSLCAYEALTVTWVPFRCSKSIKLTKACAAATHALPLTLMAADLKQRQEAVQSDLHMLKVLAALPHASQQLIPLRAARNLDPGRLSRELASSPGTFPCPPRSQRSTLIYTVCGGDDEVMPYKGSSEAKVSPTEVTTTG